MKKTISINNKTQNHILYAVLSVFLILLGLLSLESITLSHSLLVTFGIVAITAIFILAFTDLTKLLLMFVLYIPFSRLLPGDFGTETWAFNLTNIFVIFIILSLCVEKIKSKVTNLSLRSSITIPVILFCLLGLISFINSGSYFGYLYFSNFISPFKEWLNPFLIFFIFLIGVKDKEDIKQFVMFILFITVCISIFVILEYLKVRGAEDFEKMRVGTIFEQPNTAGAFFVYYSVLLVSFFLMNIRKAKYWLLSLPILLSMRALMYTYSRGAIIAFACAGLFITFVKNKLFFLLLCCFIIFALLNPGILPSSLYKRFASTFTGEPDLMQNNLEASLEPSAQTRLVIWKGAVEMIKDNLFFGVGYGVFPHLISTYAPVRRMDAHNTYLIIAAELGIFALIIFLWIIALIFKNTWFVYRKSKDKFIKTFALGFLAGIVGLLACNMFGSRLESQELSGYFWILSALIFKSKQLIKQGKLS